MSRTKTLAALALLLAAGCFPIELDVSKDGKLLIPRQEGFFVFDPAAGKVQKVCDAEGGKPVFARFSPDGKEILTVTKVEGGLNDFRFAVVPLGGGKDREIYKGSNTGYVRYSPDGASIAITRGSEKEDPQFKERVPEVVVVAVKDGTTKVAARKVGVLFRWFADSKRLLVFELAKKDERGTYFGNLAIVDIAAGKSTPVVAAAVNTHCFFDLSPDNKKVLFTALRADKAGADVSKGNEFEAKLFELDVASGAVRKTERTARYAIYSPDGKKVLLGTPPEGFALESLKLEIADAGDLTKAMTVASDAHMPLITFGGEGVTFPGWVNDKTVFYFAEKRVYGTEGKSLTLMTVGADGKGRKCVQPLIDLEIFKENP